MGSIVITTDNTVDTILIENGEAIEIVEAGFQGIQGPRGISGDGSGMDDTVTSAESTYSSFKIEERIGEEVGSEELNLTLLFENMLSQGN